MSIAIVGAARDVGRAIDGRRWGPHALLFALALALRSVWVLWVDRVGFVLNDALIYHINAESLSKGDGFTSLTGDVSAQWPPGYSVVLGALYKVFGVRPTVGELFNALIGAITVVLLMVLVERILDRRTAIIAGTILAVMPGPILWTDMLVTETIFTALFVTLFVVLAYAEPTARWMIAIGVVIGVGALVRGEAVTWGLLPIVFFWRRLPWKEFLGRIAAIGAVAILVLTPWIIRNIVVMDAFVPTGTNASHTLWVGHNPDATGGQVYPPPGYEDQFDQEAPHKELQAAQALRNSAIEYMVTHPLHELQLIPLKLIHLNRGDSYAFDWINAVPPGEPAPVAPINVERIGVLADAAYFTLLALTLAGAVLLGRRWWADRVLRCLAASMLTALFLYGFMYYGNYRYRLPFEPLMMIVASSLVARVWAARHTLVRERRGTVAG